MKASRNTVSRPRASQKRQEAGRDPEHASRQGQKVCPEKRRPRTLREVHRSGHSPPPWSQRKDMVGTNTRPDAATPWRRPGRFSLLCPREEISKKRSVHQADFPGRWMRRCIRPRRARLGALEQGHAILAGWPSSKRCSHGNRCKKGAPLHPRKRLFYLFGGTLKAALCALPSSPALLLYFSGCVAVELYLDLFGEPLIILL